MADDLISSLYPPPPPYYKFFTDENVEKLEQWRETNQEQTKEQTEEQTKEEPPTENAQLTEDVIDAESINRKEIEKVDGELKFLVPPPPPPGTHYRNYGNIWSFEDKLPSLSNMGLRQLYPEEDSTITSKAKIEQLHKLLDSLLLNFLELIGLVSIEPEKFHFKIEDLKIILININHILNSYRPHQSRESLIMLLKRQIEAKRKEISDIETVTGDIKLKITSLVDKLVSIEDPAAIAPVELSKSESCELEKKQAIEKLLSSI